MSYAYILVNVFTFSFYVTNVFIQRQNKSYSFSKCILDTERSEEAISYTMIFILILIFFSPYKFSTRNNARVI